MKCIIKALGETKYNPKTKWWGFEKDDFRYLCRYNHVMCIFDKEGTPLYKYEETKTDKAGLKYAIAYMKNKNNSNEINKICDGRSSANTRRDNIIKSTIGRTRGSH